MDPDVERYLNERLQEHDHILIFNPKEIRERINKLNNKKTPGNDLITVMLLKELARNGLVTKNGSDNNDTKTRQKPN